MNADREAALQALLDKAAIREVTMRYCLGVDRRDYEMVRSCFAPDAYFAHPGVIEGRGHQRILGMIKGIEKYHVTMHTAGTQLIEIHDDTAKAETYVVAYHRGVKDGQEREMVMGIRYVDELERRDGRWAFTTRLLIPVWRRGQSLLHPELR